MLQAWYCHYAHHRTLMHTVSRISLGCCVTDVSDVARAVLLNAGATVVLLKPTPRGLLEKIVRDMIIEAAI
jgi:hypothetical protein